MPFHFLKSWRIVNNYLLYCNAFLFGLLTLRVMTPEKINQTKITVLWNFILLLALLAVCFIMTYGQYRRVEGLG